MISLDECLSLKQKDFWKPYARPEDRERGNAVLIRLISETYRVSEEFARKADELLLQAQRQLDMAVPRPERWPMPTFRAQLLDTIVKKAWQPPGDHNPFEAWNAQLAPSGELVVAFAALLLNWTTEEIRDNLAGMAIGLGAPYLTPAPNETLSPDSMTMNTNSNPLITVEQIKDALTEDERHTRDPANGGVAERLCAEMARQTGADAYDLFKQALDLWELGADEAKAAFDDLSPEQD